MEDQPQEGVRSWYERTTKKARRNLLWSSAITAVVAVVIFVFASEKVILRAQLFNGAMTIPAAGGIWIISFIFMFLIPTREASFRGQESFERLESRLDDLVEKKLSPAIDVWKRIGEKVEARIDAGLGNEIQEAIQEVRSTASEIRDLSKGADARLKSIEREIRPAIEEIREATVHVRAFVAPQAPAPINFDRTLQSIRRGKPVAQTPQNGNERASS